MYIFVYYSLPHKYPYTIFRRETRQHISYFNLYVISQFWWPCLHDRYLVKYIHESEDDRGYPCVRVLSLASRTDGVVRIELTIPGIRSNNAPLVLAFTELTRSGFMYSSMGIRGNKAHLIQAFTYNF